MVKFIHNEWSPTLSVQQILITASMSEVSCWPITSQIQSSMFSSSSILSKRGTESVGRRCSGRFQLSRTTPSVHHVRRVSFCRKLITVHTTNKVQLWRTVVTTKFTCAADWRTNDSSVWCLSELAVNHDFTLLTTKLQVSKVLWDESTSSLRRTYPRALQILL